MTRVDFYLGDTLAYSDPEPPFLWKLNTSGLSGIHSVRASAYAGPGLTASDTITFSVDNEAPSQGGALFVRDSWEAEIGDCVFAGNRAHYGAANPQSVWLLELVTHIYHHRGQLYAYLKMMGVPVDVEHLYT